jgi:hypothetical protein
MCSIFSEAELMVMMTHSWQGQGQMDNSKSNRVPPQVQLQNHVVFAWRLQRTQSSCHVAMSACVPLVQPFSKPKGLTANPKGCTYAPCVGHG